MQLALEQAESAAGAYWRLATDRQHSSSQLLNQLGDAAGAGRATHYSGRGYNICLWAPPQANRKAFAHDARAIIEEFYSNFPHTVKPLPDEPCRPTSHLTYLPDASLHIRATARGEHNWKRALRRSAASLFDLPGVTYTDINTHSRVLTLELANSIFLAQKERIAAAAFKILEAGLLL